MKKKLFILPLLVLIAALITLLNTKPDTEPAAGKKPNDWFLMQRAFPYAEINYEAFRDAYYQASEMKNNTGSRTYIEPWELAGPTNLGGRISAIAMHEDDMQTIYAGAASGGVFKSTDGGQNWSPIFDDAASLSIGDVEVAASDPDIIYVGTGEANAGGGSLAYDGVGVYKSENGGQDWEYKGLENSGSIGRVAVNPNNPDVLYVAAMGRLFSNNSERGIFRSTDGGNNWENVLFISDSTGGIDVVVHPDNPDTVYAAMWERVRRPDRRSYGGPTCGIYRSYDGGDNWTELAGGLPTGSNIGRIGFDISKSDPNVLYAIYADKIGYFAGVFKTEDHGDSWTQTNDASLSSMYASYGWWFGRIHIDPTDPDVIYPIGFDLYKSSNGGNSYSNISSSVHVDQHDLYVHPQNPDFVVLGNDGGVYLSYNAGGTWSHVEGMPVTQFYTCEIDYQLPERLYGGTQDLGTNRTLTGGLDDWHRIYGGDGFYVLVDPTDNSYVYAEWQYGGFGKSSNGGVSFSYATSGINNNDRFNWMTPFVFNPLNPKSLYLGSQRLYKTINRADNWTAISPDLTNGPGSGNLTYGTITTISVSAADTNFIWVGTDDGNVSVSLNNGGSWENVSATLPERWVTRVTASPHDANTAFVCLSGYRYDSYIPHILMTSDAGQNWTDISGNLPEAPVNDIIIDPDHDSVLYIGTDFGVFVTGNLCETWEVMGAELPNSPIVDLDLHNPTRTLVAASYGRSMYTFNLDHYVAVDQNRTNDPELKIWPNPVKDIMNIEIDAEITGIAHIDIFDVQGRWIKNLYNGQLKGDANLFSVNLYMFGEGTYLIRFVSGDKAITRKILKK